MFEEIFYPQSIAKYRDAPLADHRAEYLVHLKAAGTSRATLRKYADDYTMRISTLSVCSMLATVTEFAGKTLKTPPCAGERHVVADAAALLHLKHDSGSSAIAPHW